MSTPTDSGFDPITTDEQAAREASDAYKNSIDVYHAAWVRLTRENKALRALLKRVGEHMDLSQGLCINRIFKDDFDKLKP